MAVVTRDTRRAAGHAVLRIFSSHLLAVPLAATCVALAFALSAEVIYADRALPGVTAGGVAVGSLDRNAIRDRLEGALARPWADALVVARYGVRTWETTNGALGVSPDIDAAALAALDYGKTGTPVERLLAWVDALSGEAFIPFTLRAEGDALERWLGTVSASLDRPAVSGDLRIVAGALVSIEPTLGVQLDRSATAAAALTAESLGDREIALNVRSVFPAVDEAGFRSAFESARAALTPLTVSVQDRRWSEDPGALSTLLVIDRVVAQPGDLPALPSGAMARATRYRYVVSLSDGRLLQWTSALAGVLDRPGQSARYSVSREGELTVAPSADGIRVDQGKLKALLAVELLRPAGGPAREVVAPASLDRPPFTSEEAALWLPQLSRTSTFTTYYPPNASRHANISIGASQFDGVVILPGQVFSFWDLLGAVTTERGYAYAGAIINNRSDENVIGGGLCQVSTTLFNAVARLGYEIVERHSHGYLIERYPLGLDAAVFQPGSDFRWRNDTPNPVFVWSWAGDTSITFDVWSLPTGRTVTFSDAAQWNFVPVPPTQLADPAFPPGYQIPGRDTARTRTVVADGKVVHLDTFFSRYAPVWGGPAG